MFLSSLDVIVQDLLSAVEAKEALEREVKGARERLLAGQRAREASQRELSALDTRLKAGLGAAAAAQSRLAAFTRSVAALLGDSLGAAGPTDEAILEKIREMSSQEESRKRVSG